MATLTMEGFGHDLEAVPDSVLKEMLEAEAEIYVQAEKDSLAAYGVRDTGQLIASIKAGSPKRRSGVLSVDITPEGSRKRGKVTTTNAEIAYVNEYGKRGQPARPAIREGDAKAEAPALAAAEAIYDKYLQSMT